MTKLPIISIIIPVYNVEEYIAECLQSVMRQTYAGPMECIIVDDCGTDKSIETAKQLIEDYTIENQKSKFKNPISFRIIHHDHNRGLSAARNTGTDTAMGDYIYYLDSDDYISNDCIEVLTQPLKEFNYDMVIGDIQEFGRDMIIPPIAQPTGAIVSNQAISNALYGATPLYSMACNRLVKHSLFAANDLTFLEGQLHEDELWKYKCCRVLESLYIQHSITYHYRRREDSITGKRTYNSERRAQSHYASADYVLSHPAAMPQEIWNNVILYYMGFYTSASIQPFKNTWPQYYSLRKRIDYHPVRDWRQGKLPLKDLKHRLAYALPPFLGYVYLKIRKLKHIILS